MMIKTIVMAVTIIAASQLPKQCDWKKFPIKKASAAGVESVEAVAKVEEKLIKYKHTEEKV